MIKKGVSVTPRCDEPNFLTPGNIGVYEHFHPDENFANEAGYGTHYIVLSFRLQFMYVPAESPRMQYREFKWFSIENLQKEATVYRYVKNYFNGMATF